jgi:putative spermidine/putrescine transport system substrate-binding protein/spermidine/putrescine transport system substrate-binding protein
MQLQEGVDLRMRQARKALAIALLLAGVVAAGCGDDDSDDGGGGSEPAKAEELNVLAWEGYAEPEWVEGFEEEHGVKVNVTYIGTTDEMLAKLRGQGGDAYDVLATEQAIGINDYAKKGLVVPMDESKLNLDGIAPAFKETPSLMIDGKRYGVPFVWGGTTLGYNTDEFDTPPDSWEVVFDGDSEACGKVIWSADPEVTTATAALYLGFDKPFGLTDDQLAEVKRVLEDSRDCTVAVYSGLGDAANFYASGDAVAGLNSGPLITKKANDAGTPIVETVPKEGALHWLDCWAVTPAGEKKGDLVYDWINYEISPEVQAQVVNATGFGPAATGIGEGVDPEIAKILHLDDPSYLEGLIPYSPYEAPDSREKHLDVWNAVRAGS